MSDLLAAIGRLDVAAFRWLQHHHIPALTPLMAALTDVARAGSLWIVLGVLVALARPRRWPAAVQLFLAIAICTLATDYAAKPFFDRARPFEDDTAVVVHGMSRPSTRSFPSGHAVNAVAGAYALTRMAPDARAIFWALAAGVAVSRVYLGVHYPLDVVAGALMGWGLAGFVVGGTRWRAARSVLI